MHLSIARVRNGLHSISRKVAVEVLVSGASALLAMTILSHTARPTAAFGPAERPQAGMEEKLAADAAIKAFIESAALSALSSNARIEPTAQPVAIGAAAEADAPAPRASVQLQPRHPASAKPRLRVWRPASRFAVLPPPRPQFAVAAAAPAPAQAKSLAPLQHVARLSNDLWDSASSAGAFVVDNVASAGDQLGAMAKGLM